MKTIKIIAAVTLLCVVSAVSFCVGRNYEYKHYGKVDHDAACRMSDLIRCYKDHLTEDSLIEDYGCFEELEYIYLKDDGIGPIINLEDYSCCY